VWTGDGWNLSVRPNLQLRLPDSMGVVYCVTNAELTFDVNLYPGETRQYWGVLSFKVGTQPRDRNNAMASVELEVVRW